MSGPRTSRSRFGPFASARITRGALIVAGLELGLSLVWLLADDRTRFNLAEYAAASPYTVLDLGHVWTLATSPFLVTSFLPLLLHMVVLWMFVPTLERFWGTNRFYRFVAVTSLAGTVGGVLAGLALGDRLTPSAGLDPMIDGAIVAFGVVYARQPVQFFGAIPLTGRQLMWGWTAFLAASVLLQQHWVQGASMAAGMLAAALMTSKRWSPGLAWKRWRLARKRAHLSVLTGGDAKPKKKPGEKYLN